VTEAPELLFFSGHGTSSAHPSPATVKQTIGDLANLRGELASGSVRVVVVGACSSGKSTLINALLGETRLGRTEQSVGQRPITLWDAADAYGAAQFNDDEPIMPASVAEDVVPPIDGAQPAAAHVASSRATDRLLSRSRSGESTRENLIWSESSVCDPTAFGPWSRYASADVQPIILAQSFEYGCRGIVIVPCPPAQNLRDILGCRVFRLTFQEDALPGSTAVFLRFIDGILAALRLMLVLVLSALSQQPDALAFVLVILATCLRYGRREEGDDHAFLLIRRFQISLGRCPPG
jgi:hypothetical protein